MPTACHPTAVCSRLQYKAHDEAAGADPVSTWSTAAIFAFSPPASSSIVRQPCLSAPKPRAVLHAETLVYNSRHLHQALLTSTASCILGLRCMQHDCGGLDASSRAADRRPALAWYVLLSSESLARGRDTTQVQASLPHPLSLLTHSRHHPCTLHTTHGACHDVRSTAFSGTAYPFLNHLLHEENTERLAIKIGHSALPLIALLPQQIFLALLNLIPSCAVDHVPRRAPPAAD